MREKENREEGKKRPGNERGREGRWKKNSRRRKRE